MIFQIAFILVAIGIISTIWAMLEILFLEIILREQRKTHRSKSVRNGFDK